MSPRPTQPIRAVRRIAVARLISIAGGAAAYTALMYTVYERTGSATWLSATLFLTFGVGGFFAPVGGMIGDRFDRRRVMVVSDLLGAACFGAMALSSDPGWLLGFAFVSAVVETPFWSASGAAIPNLVPAERLSWANGLVQLGKNAGVTLGPAVGGLLLWRIGASWVFALNAASFVVSAVLVASVHARFSADRTAEQEDAHRGLRAGFVFIARDRLLRTLVIAYVALVFGMGLVMVADVPLVELFGAGAVGYGLLITCWGGGAVAGSLAGRWLNEEKEPKVLFLGLLLIGLTTAAIAISPWFAPILVLVLLSGIGDAVTIVADQGIQQRRTPDVVRSRVMAASEALVTIAYAVALVLAAPVLEATGPQQIYLIGGATAVLGAGLLWPVLRRRPSAEQGRSEIPVVEEVATAG